MELAGGRLPAGLHEEEQVAPIIKVPGEALLREDGGVSERRTGSVFAEAGGIGHERAGRHAIEHAVVVFRVRRMDVLHGDAHADPSMDRLDLVKTAGAAICDEQPPRHVVAMPVVEHRTGKCDRRTTRAENDRVAAGPGPMSVWQKRLQREAAGDHVLGMADEQRMASRGSFHRLLRDAADLAEQFGVGVERVEHVAAGREQVDLVRSHERAEGQRIVLDELHDTAVHGRVIVPLAVDAAQGDFAQPPAQAKMRGPLWKHRHDRALAGGHTDEIHGRPCGRLEYHVGRGLHGGQDDG